MRNADKPFSVTVCKYSRTRQKGGEIITYPNALLAKQQSNEFWRHLISFKLVDLPDLPPQRHYIYLLLYFNGKKILMK